MIYELRTYTLKPGTAVAAAHQAGTIGKEIRGDDYGKLEGFWMSEVGTLNQVLHLWSYKDLNERMQLRDDLGRNQRWVTEYIPLIRPMFVRQEIRILKAVMPPVAPAEPGNIYELRNYFVKPGMIRDWVGNFSDIMPVREKYSKICGLFTTEFGNPNEVCHLWAYRDFNARVAARGGVAQDPAWKEFLGKSAAMLEEMHSMIMLPASHSPLK